LISVIPGEPAMELEVRGDSTAEEQEGPRRLDVQAPVRGGSLWAFFLGQREGFRALIWAKRGPKE
jgi:hypothetical protein